MEDYWDCKRPRSFKITLIVVRGMWIRIKITINYHKCDYFFCHIMVIVVQISISESSITHAVSFVSISFLFSRTNCKHQLLLGDLLDNGSANHEGVQRLSIILDWFSMYKDRRCYTRCRFCQLFRHSLYGRLMSKYIEYRKIYRLQKALSFDFVSN